MFYASPLCHLCSLKFHNHAITIAAHTFFCYNRTYCLEWMILKTIRSCTGAVFEYVCTANQLSWCKLVNDDNSSWVMLDLLRMINISNTDWNSHIIIISTGVIGFSDPPIEWPPGHSVLGLIDPRSPYPRNQWPPDQWVLGSSDPPI